MNLTDFLCAAPGSGSGGPSLITSFTSGTGTYIPTIDNARCLVRIQGAGGGSRTSAGSAGGSGGAMVEIIMRVPIGGVQYVIGAGGINNQNGGYSRFGQFVAQGGFAFGGAGSTGAIVSEALGLAGISGGAGGHYSNGRAPGWPTAEFSTFGGGGSVTVWSNGLGLGYGGPYGSGNIYGGGGGDSFYGIGGNGEHGAGPGYVAATGGTGYGQGAGGAFNVAGAAVGGGGYIEIWDYGA